MPGTRLGKWSVGLAVGFLALFGVVQLLRASGQQPGETIFSNPIWTIPVLLLAACGTLAFLTGVVSVAKDRERGLLVYVATIVGLLVTVFWIGEVVVPHG